MSENDKTVPPIPPAPEMPAAPAAPAPVSGRVSMGEEMDRAKWTMPAAVPIVIALALVAIGVFVTGYVNRSKPSATGKITKVMSVAQGDTLMVAIHMRFDNVTDSRLWIKSIQAELETADGKKYEDSAAPAVDIDRYLNGLPTLAEGRIDPLKEEMKIMPGSSQAGMIIVAFPVKQADFDGRKSLHVRMGFYDHPGMVVQQ